MKRIPESIIEDIKSKLLPSEVISQYVTLTKKSDRLWGLCPFHQEKTPSFSVQDEKGFYHCFGCGKSGTIFNFIMDIENLDFPDAVSLLAKKAGIEIIPETEQDSKKRSEKDALIELNNRLADMFHYILLHKPAAEHALNYLKQRGISKKSIEEFKLGYAPANRNWLYSFLLSKNYSDDFLKKTGLFSKNHTGYPLFRDRIIFPIFNRQGSVVAFGGRALRAEEQAKYINSPETEVYKKRENLYGLFQSIAHIKQKQDVYLCEGYFDVIALHQVEQNNAVAPLGTSFTLEQAEILHKFTDSGTLLFDMDSAGKEAAKKTLFILGSVGMNISAVELPGAKDPAEFLVENGESALLDAVNNKINGFNYLVKNLLNMYDINLPEGKLAIYNEVKPYIQSLDSEIKRYSLLKTLADMIHVDESVIISEFQKGIQNDRSKTRNSNYDFSGNHNIGERFGVRTLHRKLLSGKNSESFSLSIELFLMLTIVNNRKYFTKVRRIINLEDLEDQKAKEIFTALEESFREGENTIEYLLERIEDSVVRRIIESSVGSEEFIENAELIVSDILQRLRIRTLENKRKSIERKLKEADADGTPIVKITELLYEKKFIDEEIEKMRNP